MEQRHPKTASTEPRGDVVPGYAPSAVLTAPLSRARMEAGVASRADLHPPLQARRYFLGASIRRREPLRVRHASAARPLEALGGDSARLMGRSRAVAVLASLPADATAARRAPLVTPPARDVSTTTRRARAPAAELAVIANASRDCGRSPSAVPPAASAYMMPSPLTHCLERNCVATCRACARTPRARRATQPDAAAVHRETTSKTRPRAISQDAGARLMRCAESWATW